MLALARGRKAHDRSQCFSEVSFCLEVCIAAQCSFAGCLPVVYGALCISREVEMPSYQLRLPLGEIRELNNQRLGGPQMIAAP